MSRIAAFMFLDFRARPLISRIFMPVFILLTIMAFIFGDSSDKVSAFVYILPTLIIMSIVQQFDLMRKNRMETLYATLPLTRDDIVKAKYLSFVCFLTLVTLPSPFIMSLFYPTNKNINFYMATYFLLCSFFAAVLHPLAFKASEKTMNFIFMITTIFYVITGRSLMKNISHLNLNELPTPLVMVMVIVALILLYLSHLLSLRIYRNKDL